MPPRSKSRDRLFLPVGCPGAMLVRPVAGAIARAW
jgi:hypothetical protein